MEKIRPLNQNQRFIVETITMTTVTERRIVREAATTEDITGQQTKNAATNPQISTGVQYDNSTIAGEQGINSGNITGILKGGKLRKTDSIQVSLKFYSSNFLKKYIYDHLSQFSHNMVSYSPQILPTLFSLLTQPSSFLDHLQFFSLYFNLLR